MTSKKLKFRHTHVPCKNEKKKPVGRDLAALGLGALGLAAASCSAEKPFTLKIPVKKEKPMIVTREDGTEEIIGIDKSVNSFAQKDIEISALDVAQVALILLIMRYSSMDSSKNKQE